MMLSLAWVAQRPGPPPMSIGPLLHESAMPPGARAAVDTLLREKLEAPELGTRRPIVEIDAWVVEELERLDPARLALPAEPRRDTREAADRLYPRIIGVGA